MAKKVFYVSSNEQRGTAGVFLENLLSLRALGGGLPLLIEPEGGLLPPRASRKKLKERALRAFDFLPTLDFAAIPTEKAKNLPVDGNKPEIRAAEEKFTEVFMYGDVTSDTLPLVSLADHIIVVLKNNVYAAGYLYTLVKSLHDGLIPKKILVVLADVRYIEDAALSFKRYREELAGMVGEIPDVHFMGFFPVDAKYLAHAAQRGRPCVKVFPDSAFHGAFKYISRNLDGLEICLRDLPFFYSLAKTNRNDNTP